MSEIDRDAFLELLEHLSSDDDVQVLAAARTIRQQMTDADVAWDMLLVKAPDDDDHGHHEPYDLEDDEPEVEDDEPDEADVDAEAASPGGAVRTPKDDLAMIDELLNKHQLAEATREELSDYKTDIGEGEFSEADHRYLLALYQRVTGKKR